MATHRWAIGLALLAIASTAEAQVSNATRELRTALRVTPPRGLKPGDFEETQSGTHSPHVPPIYRMGKAYRGEPAPPALTALAALPRPVVAASAACQAPVLPVPTESAGPLQLYSSLLCSSLGHPAPISRTGDDAELQGLNTPPRSPACQHGKSTFCRGVGACWPSTRSLPHPPVALCDPCRCCGAGARTFTRAPQSLHGQWCQMSQHAAEPAPTTSAASSTLSAPKTRAAGAWWGQLPAQHGGAVLVALALALPTAALIITPTTCTAQHTTPSGRPRGAALAQQAQQHLPRASSCLSPAPAPLTPFPGAQMHSTQRPLRPPDLPAGHMHPQLLRGRRRQHVAGLELQEAGDAVGGWGIHQRDTHLCGRRNRR